MVSKSLVKVSAKHCRKFLLSTAKLLIPSFFVVIIEES